MFKFHELARVYDPTTGVYYDNVEDILRLIVK